MLAHVDLRSASTRSNGWVGRLEDAASLAHVKEKETRAQ